MSQSIEELERIVALRKKLWRTAYDALEKCIWQRGLLRKGMGLCHGISGNGYTFLILERYLAYEQKRFEDSHSITNSYSQGEFFLCTDAEDYLSKRRMLFAQASCFLSKCLDVERLTRQEEVRTPDHPYSLMEGLGGTVIYAMDLLEPEQCVGFPCLNDV